MKMPRGSRELEKAERARQKQAQLLRTCRVSSAISAPLLLALLTATVLNGLSPLWICLATAAVVALLGSLFRKMKRLARVIPESLDAAWLSLVEELAEQTDQPITVRHLTEMLPISGAQAEEILAVLQAENIVLSRESDSGELTYVLISQRPATAFDR